MVVTVDADGLKWWATDEWTWDLRDFVRLRSHNVLLITCYTVCSLFVAVSYK